MPLTLPLALWSTGFFYCYAPALSSSSNGSETRPTFHRWYFIHNLHNIGAMLIGLLSLYFNDDSIFNERIQVLWNVSYFIVDLADCIIQRNKEYTLHALLCLVMGFYGVTVPIVLSTRTPSKLSFVEISNPFRYMARKTKKVSHSALFFLVYTLCRIVYIPFIIDSLRNVGMQWTAGPMIVTCVVYGLQLWWWYKMWRIVIKTARGKASRDDIKPE